MGEVALPPEVAAFFERCGLDVRPSRKCEPVAELLSELRAIRAELQAMRDENARRAERQAEAATKPAPTYPTMAGPVPAAG